MRFKLEQRVKIEEYIKTCLEMGGSHYFHVENDNDVVCKVRVSDHSANKNNNGDHKAISFVSNTCNQFYNQMESEYMVEDADLLLVDSYSSSGQEAVYDLIQEMF